MSLSDLLPFLVAVIGGSGLIGGVIALLKLRPEAGQIIVTAAQGAVIVQTGVIDSLREENERLRHRVDALEAEMGSVDSPHRRIQMLEDEREVLRAENGRLRERVRHLEEDLRQIKGGQ